MSMQADKHFVEQYNSRAYHLYQSEGFLLKSTVMPAEKIEGTKAYFPIFGKMAANKKVRGQKATPANAERSRAEAVLETWEVFDYVYKYDLSRTNVNERENLALAGAKALGRGTDHEIMQALYAKASTAAPVGSGLTPNLAANEMPGMVGGATADFTLETMLKMSGALSEAEVPDDGNIYCPLPSRFWNIAMTYKQFNSAEWVGDDLSFTKVTKAKKWNGVNWFKAPSEYFQQPAGDSSVDLVMWHMNAAGWANNEELFSHWAWDNELGAWSMRMESEGAAAVILPQGLVRGRFKTNSALTVS